MLPPRPISWWRRRPDARGVRRAMPLLLAATAIATAAMRSYEQSRPAVTPPPSPPTAAASADTSTIVPVYGDPTAAVLRPEQGNAAARRVCLDETRPLPTTGPWKCHSWEPLDASSIGRKATGGSGPCTHRVADDASGAWELLDADRHPGARARHALRGAGHVRDASCRRRRRRESAHRPGSAGRRHAAARRSARGSASARSRCRTAGGSPSRSIPAARAPTAWPTRRPASGPARARLQRTRGRAGADMGWRDRRLGTTERRRAEGAVRRPPPRACSAR